MANHPYYPVNVPIPDYVPNDRGVWSLLAIFAGLVIGLANATVFIARRVQPELHGKEMRRVVWFTLCGAIHIIFEGYFVVNNANLASKETLMGQLWKEYALSDSRYLTQNSTVLCLEAITMLCVGPLCLVTAVLIVLRHPLRYSVQSVVSVAQLYGVTVYYATAFYDHLVNGVRYSRPEAFYSQFYFVGLNLPWIVVPAILIYESSLTTAHAISTTRQIGSTKKSG